MPYQKYINNEELNIARGLVRNTSHVHKFGATPEMSISATGTIWDINDTKYPWNALATANSIVIPAVNSSDNGKILTIQGLDSNYNLQSANVTLSSSSSSTTTETFTRVFRAFIANGGDTNVGVIDMENGNSTKVARINIDKAQTLMSVYSVPANTTVYLKGISCSVEKAGDATVDLYVRPLNGTFRTKHSFEVTDGSPYQYYFPIPLKFGARSDIDVRASMRSNNSRITATLDLILIEDS